VAAGLAGTIPGWKTAGLAALWRVRVYWLAEYCAENPKRIKHRGAGATGYQRKRRRALPEA